MALRDLSAYLDDDALELPIDGTTYRIPSPDAKTGLWLTSLADLGVTAASGSAMPEAELERLRLDDDQEKSFVAMVLGSGYQDMIDGGVSWVKIQRASRYAFIYFAMGPEVADRALANGSLSGEAAAPNRTARRQASKATAPSTRSRGSIAGTTPRKPRAAKG